MPRLSISALTDAFPEFRVAVIFGEGLTVAPSRSPELAAEIAATEARCRASHAGTELSAIPGVAAWRSAYRAFGIKKTSYRSSVERLIKRVLAGDALPEVNALVDAYNAASVEHGLCLGCDDFDLTSGELAFRFSRADDTFIDMGAGEGEDPNDPPKPGEVVYANQRHVLCRRWNWRQDARTKVTLETRRIVLTVQSNGSGDVEAAAAALVETLRRECGGVYAVAVADRSRPEVAV
jgi:DNA/RNA-binding domain of Phe-tRNA-synthetase-like protein